MAKKTDLVTDKNRLSDRENTSSGREKKSKVGRQNAAGILSMSGTDF